MDTSDIDKSYTPPDPVTAARRTQLVHGALLALAAVSFEWVAMLLEVGDHMWGVALWLGVAAVAGWRIWIYWRWRPRVWTHFLKGMAIVIVSDFVLALVVFSVL